MSRVLITRLSSFGDVTMLVPVIFSVASRYPQDRFVVLTRKAFAPLFENLGFNINTVTFDPNRHDSVFGFLRLVTRLSGSGYSHLADVHDVLRTKVIRSSMLLRGTKVAHIDKGRDDKNKMIASKQLTPPLKPTIERYMDVFAKLGFPAEMIFDNYFELKQRSLYPLRAIVTERVGTWIGIAPFSKYKEKIYPLDKMEKVVAELSKRANTTVFLFGSGSEERAVLDKWTQKYTNVVSVSGKLKLENELLLMSYLNIMISMDSANMHLASLVKIPTVSIWGATHPSLGFGGFNQDKDNMIGVDNLPCRPCSVFGNVPCSRGDLACLNTISESTILDKVEMILKKSKIEEIPDQIKSELDNLMIDD